MSITNVKYEEVAEGPTPCIPLCTVLGSLGGGWKCDNLQGTTFLCVLNLDLGFFGLRLPQTRPSGLVLIRRVDHGSKFQSGPQDKVWVPQKLSSNEDDVCLAFLQVIVSLFAFNDEPDGADLEVRNGLLDSSSEVDL